MCVCVRAPGIQVVCACRDTSSVCVHQGYNGGEWGGDVVCVCVHQGYK